MFGFSSSTEARVELSAHKPGNSDQKEVNTSSLTQSPAGVLPTSLEQVQTLPTNKHVPVSYDVSNDQRGAVLQLEEEEGEDQFDLDVAVTNPEKVGQSLFLILLRLLCSLFISKELRRAAVTGCI